MIIFLSFNDKNIVQITKNKYIKKKKLKFNLIIIALIATLESNLDLVELDKPRNSPPRYMQHYINLQNV